MIMVCFGWNRDELDERVMGVLVVFFCFFMLVKVFVFMVLELWLFFWGVCFWVGLFIILGAIVKDDG